MIAASTANLSADPAPLVLAHFCHKKRREYQFSLTTDWIVLWKTPYRDIPANREYENPDNLKGKFSFHIFSLRTGKNSTTIAAGFA